MKKHNVKRVLSLLLACMMLFQTPFAALADGMGFEEFIILDDASAEDGGLVFEEPAEGTQEENISSGTGEVLDFGDELIIDEGFMEEEVSDMASGEDTETEAETEVETELASEAESEVETEVETEEDLLIEEVIEEEAAELAAAERTASPASGSGTQEDPYVITAADQLPTAILANEWYALGANLTLDADQQITTLAGVLDGRGHVVTLNGSALAGTVSGTIRNIGVKGSVSNGGCFGSMAMTLSGAIENSYSLAALTYTNASGFDEVGGLAGSVTGGTVRNSYFGGTFSGTFSAGGIAGNVTGTVGTFANCYWIANSASGATQVVNMHWVTGSTVRNCEGVGTLSNLETEKLNTGISDAGYAFIDGTNGYPVLAEKNAVSIDPVAEANNLINGLPEVTKLTLKDKADVQAARASYDALTDDQKAGFSADTYDKLKKAEAQIAKLEAEAKKADPVNITLTVNNKGVLAKERYQSNPMVHRAVTVSDIDCDGKLTYHEALTAAHKTYHEDAEYAVTETDNGLTVTKLWGESAENTQYYQNGVCLTGSIDAVTVAEGDMLYASINRDSERYTSFDSDTKTVSEEEEFTLTLSDGTTVLSGISVGIWKDGEFSALDGKTTDSNGVVTLSFAEAGTYYVTASDTAIMAPVCIVTVKEGTEKKEYKVILPNGAGYTAAAEEGFSSTVTEGGSFRFTVTVAKGYDRSKMEVKAGETVLTAVEGIYTIDNITEDTKIVITGVRELPTASDSQGYVIVSVEAYASDGSHCFLKNPIRNRKEQYVNDAISDALRQAMGAYYNVKIDYPEDDTFGAVGVTGVADGSQADGFLDNGDDGVNSRWIIVRNNTVFKGQDYYRPDYVKGGEVIRLIFAPGGDVSAKGSANKDELIKMTASLHGKVWYQSDPLYAPYHAALDMIIDPNASQEDVDAALTALQKALIVEAISVEINQGESQELALNRSMILTATVNPSNTTDKVTWGTEDTDIVSVDPVTGEVTGLKEGTATVRAFAGNVSDSIKITVKRMNATEVTITNGNSVEVEARFAVQLEATVTPENSSDRVVWSIEDSTVAIIDENGKLTGLKEGMTTVTATAGTVSDTITVKVLPTTQPYLYFRYNDGRTVDMNIDTFTLTALDEGTFVVGNYDKDDIKWKCSENVENSYGEIEYRVWVSSSGKYQPHGVKRMEASVTGDGYSKTFYIDTVPSGITELSVFANGNQVTTENPYTNQGIIEGVTITAEGKNTDGDWVYVPTQALEFDCDINKVRILGNQMSLIADGTSEVTVALKENANVAASFNVECKEVQVTAIDVVHPEEFIIDKWDSMSSCYIGIPMGYEDRSSEYYVTYSPSYATNQELVWEALTPEIATFQELHGAGIVPKKAGTARFKVASVSNPAAVDEVIIEFKYKTSLESAAISQTEYVLKVGQSTEPQITFTPENATETRFDWSYSKDGIVRVNESISSDTYNRYITRKLIALSEGTVTVTGTPYDTTGGCEPIEFTVTVEPAEEIVIVDYLKKAKSGISHGLNYLQKEDQSYLGSEWTIFTNLRAGGTSSAGMNYLASVDAALRNENNDLQPTDYARLILTLPLLGYDPTDFGGHNLIERICNIEELDTLTSNQICWALIALDSRDYPIDGYYWDDRIDIAGELLYFQNSNGGFGMSRGGGSSVDMTCMILQALAPYIDYHDAFRDAINNGVKYLKNQLTANAGYIEGSGENACTAAQVLTTLSILGIDPTNSANGFTMGNKNLITNLEGFKLASGGYFYLENNETVNLMGTQQVTYALEAYRRLKENKRSLYDLRDVRLNGEATEDEEKAETVTDAIKGLPELDVLTVANADAVEAARAAYEALTAEQKALVSKEVVAKLEAAEAQIAELQKAAEDQEKATAAVTAIDTLPAAEKLTKADADKVKAARTAYEALTADQKALVSKEAVAKLEAAEAKIAELTHVHSWGTGTVMKNATCTAAGVKTFRCGCGETKTEAIPAAGHKYGAWKTSKEATVWAAEEQTRSCTVCKEADPNTNIVGKKLTPVLEVPGKLSAFNIKKGKTAKFAVTMAKGDSISAVSSSKTKYLKVSAVDKKTGKITLKGLKKGTSKLTITLASGKSRTYTIKVVTGTVKTNGLSVTNVTANKLTLAVKKSHTLKYERKPFTTTQKVTYKSSNKKIAKVTSGGKITAVAPGKATITVSSGSKKVKIVVTVPGITNVKSSVSVKKNKTLTLKPKVYGIGGKITYTSDKPAVATVDSKGKIKGIKKGTAKITIKAGNVTKTVTVKVK